MCTAVPRVSPMPGEFSVKNLQLYDHPFMPLCGAQDNVLQEGCFIKGTLCYQKDSHDMLLEIIVL